MRPLARLVLLLALLLLPLQVAAQTAAPIGRLEVALWPEYDQRAMLIIYRLTLSSATALPATVELPIPARIGDPTAVAQQAPDGALILADYTREAVDDEWATLAIQAESTVLQVEYYDTLSIDNTARDFTFTWPAGWPVTELAYEVLQPAGASELVVDPAPASDRLGPSGLTYQLGSLGPLDGTSAARLRVSYTKSDAGLTAESAPAAEAGDAPAIEAAQPADLPGELVRLAPWLIGGLGATLLAAGVVLYLRTRREEAPGERMRRRPPRGASEAAGSLHASTVFCHNCGTQAGVTDTFCRKCGTRLRS